MFVLEEAEVEEKFGVKQYVCLRGMGDIIK
jgi:hypothetical protein